MLESTFAKTSARKIEKKGRLINIMQGFDYLYSSTNEWEKKMRYHTAIARVRKMSPILILAITDYMFN